MKKKGNNEKKERRSENKAETIGRETKAEREREDVTDIINCSTHHSSMTGTAGNHSSEIHTHTHTVSTFSHCLLLSLSTLVWSLFSENIYSV